jgi:zinc transport system permease protein
MDKSFFSAIFSNPFLLNAIIAGILASIASGIMGTYVVSKKISSITGSIAHSILGGIGLFIWLKYKYQLSWLDPLYGAIFAAILSSLLIGYVHLKHSQNEDAVIAAIWSTGMGLGVIFISLVPSFGSDFTHFLFGNILLVSKENLYMLLALDLSIFIFISIFYNHFLAICFDEEMAYMQKVNINSLYLLLLSLISISTVLLIQIMGIILVIALLTIPSTIANFFSKKVFIIMIISFVLCAFFTFGGLALSFDLNWPPGATISIISAAAYLLTLLTKKKFLHNLKNGDPC